MYTFGPLIAKNARSGRLLGGAPVTVTTLDGVTLDTYTVDGQPLTLVTNHEGYHGTFRADTDQRVILARPRGGDPLPLYAHEAIGDAAEAADTINTGRLSEDSLTSTIGTEADRIVPGKVAEAIAEDDTPAQAAAAAVANAVEGLDLLDKPAADTYYQPIGDYLTEDNTDPAVAGVLADPESQAHSSVLGAFVDRGGLHIDPSAPAFGGTPLPDASGAGAYSTDALEAAITHAKSLRSFVGRDVARRIHLNGWYKFNRDLHLDDGGIEITGEGGNSGLVGINAGVVIGGTTALTMRLGLRNLRVRRVTTTGNPHGTALSIIGGAANSDTYPARWYLDHVEAEAPVNPNGTNPEDSIAFEARGTFLATITALYARNAHWGIVIDTDPVAGNLSANALTFLGGEIQGVERLGRIVSGIGIAFYGMAWEGASTAGMDVDDVKGLTIDGGYFEKNASYDLRVGEQVACSGIKITGGTSSLGALAGTPGAATKRSIILRRAFGVDISGIHFASYDTPPVLVNEASSRAVTGSVTNCHSSKAATPVVEVAAGRGWATGTFQSVTLNGAAQPAAFFDFTGNAGQQKAFRFRTGTSNRWVTGVDAVSESGGNAGSNLQFTAYNDDGSYSGIAFAITRSTLQTRSYADHRIDGALNHRGATAGFYSTTPIAKPTVTGSRTDGTALTSLLTALSQLGLITDNTTA